MFFLAEVGEGGLSQALLLSEKKWRVRAPTGVHPRAARDCAEVAVENRRAVGSSAICLTNVVAAAPGLDRMPVAEDSAQSTGESDSSQGGVALQGAAVLAPPPMYCVFLLNDDFTPMDFVVEVLERFFRMSREKATEVMLAVHVSGRAPCGAYPRDVAATKVEQVRQYSRQHQHPLQCVMEKA